MKNIDPTKTISWQKLQKLYEEKNQKHLVNYFNESCNRFKDFSLKVDNFLLDFSKNHLDKEIFNTLLSLVDEVKLKDAIEAMFRGQKINETEGRAVLHTALRDFTSKEILSNNENVILNIKKARNKIKLFADKITNKELKGYSNKDFTDIVNIGIGGSDLGPKMVCSALQAYKNQDLNIYFVSNVDPTHLKITLDKLNSETTLFMIASKTFTTQETMLNAKAAKDWFLTHGGKEEDIRTHFVALSTNKQKVEEFGISLNNMFEFWDFIGGRYSLWSSIGLSIACYIGYDNFEKLLQGAEKLDNHFRTAPFSKNMPIIMALIGVWYNNFWEAESEAILPYDQYLSLLPEYFQQVNMESNGKCTDRNKNKIKYQTGPIIWGQSGTNGQHAFYQLLHQGTKLIPADFLVPLKSLNPTGSQHEVLIANCIAQTESLMNGLSREEVLTEMAEHGVEEKLREKLLPYKVFTGNKPTNTIVYDSLTPENLGFLIALYEQKIFVQGIIWNVYSFDQWGVELGKKMTKRILAEVEQKNISHEHDDSTRNLILYWLQKTKEGNSDIK